MQGKDRITKKRKKISVFTTYILFLKRYYGRKAKSVIIVRIPKVAPVTQLIKHLPFEIVV
jgi:hypothetical protein